MASAAIVLHPARILIVLGGIPPQAASVLIGRILVLSYDWPRVPSPMSPTCLIGQGRSSLDSTPVFIGPTVPLSDT